MTSEDLPAPLTLGNQRFRVVGHGETRGALECRSTAGVRQAAHFVEQLVDVGVVCRVRARVAGRVNAGPAFKRCNNKARIIGDRGKPHRCGRVVCLDQRILGERRAGFRYVVDAEICLRHETDIEIAQQARDFAQFAGVAAGKNNFFRKPQRIVSAQTQALRSALR